MGFVARGGKGVNRFANLLEALAAAPGDRPFVTFWIDEDERETVTFSQFRSRACAEAGVLRAQGVGAGDRVIIIMPQSIAAMTAFVGAMMLGAAPAFLAYPNFKVEPSKYREGLAGVSANLKAKAVLIDEDSPPEFLEHVAIGRDTTVLRLGEPPQPLSEEQFPVIECGPDDLAFIQHSAGTTGLQKGVALTHGAVLRQIEHLAETLKIDGATDRIYSWLPLYHDMGLIACFMLPMVCHVPVVMQSPLDWVMHPETMLQIISECKCTLAWMPNFAFQFVPRRTRPNLRTAYDLSSLRALINCSEPVRSSSLGEFHRTFDLAGLRKSALHSSYAMAENVFAVTQSDIQGTAGPVQVWAQGQTFRAEDRVVRVAEGTAGAIAFASSGRLLPGNEIRIVSEAGEILAEGLVGEIQLKSDSLFTGYYNRADLTDKAMADGWYLTGDLGFSLDGELFVVGRKKDLLIVGGENFYPQDIEENIAAHPAIHDGRVVALGLFNPSLGTEEIIAIAEVENAELLSRALPIEKEIRRRVVEGIGIAMRAVFLKPPGWIVKSTAGKAARSATREKLLKEHPELNLDARENQRV
jgi:fatty-acyl-CoA synthase